MQTLETAGRRASLRRRLLFGLLVYVALLSVAVAVHGLIVNEHAEQLVWQTLLNTELDHLEERIAKNPDYRWSDTSNMSLFDSREKRPIPADLKDLAPGVHDDVMVNGKERVVLVRLKDGHRLILSLDISAFEEREQDMTLTVVGSALTLLFVLSLLCIWAASRLVGPLTRMANEIRKLRPDRQGQRLELQTDASSEIEVISDALNGYLARNDNFVERERAFVDMASHELRTPIAVIIGASDLALQSSGISPHLQNLIDRIHCTANGVQELIAMLLVLAKDPARLRQADEHIALESLVQAIVEDHQHLAVHKDLTIRILAEEAIEVVAPLQVVRAALGNLLRNAIENSDRGEIQVRLEAPATIIIQDPGHGMSPEEISATYERIARGGGGRAGSGIGLDLISRLCEHLNWSMQFESDGGRGTTVRLQMMSASIAPKI